MLLECAPAKVNLFLHVTGRRPDGYHTLDSLAVFAGAADVLSAEPADRLSLEITGSFAASLRNGDNLVLRAARALADAIGGSRGALLRLDKRLPVASGIGGGSADAAATLRLLVRLWECEADLPLPRGEGVSARIGGIALALGADVPVCLAGRAARMGGIGEALSDAPAMPSAGLLLVNPGLAVSTAEVFRARAGRFSPPASLPAAWPDAAAMADDLRGLSNDLEPPARALCPAIDGVLAAIQACPDCLLARMSGSGATCFGLFPSAVEAAHAARLVERPGWWAWGGAL